MDIFISYKKEDFQIASTVVAALQAEGFTVWWDEDLTPKGAWDARLEQEIATAITVVVLWSPRSVASDWVRSEAHYGQDRAKLVQVIIEPCAVPIAFILRQAVNLCEWHGDRTDRQWRKLLAWISDFVAAGPGNTNTAVGQDPIQPNRFRDAVGHLACGDPIVDGALVNGSTPAGTVFRDGEQMPVLRILPQGSFLLGSPATDPDRTAVEGPQKRVEIPAPFALGVFPVLGAEYRALMGVLPAVASSQPMSRGLFGKFKRPIEQVVAAVSLNPLLPVTQVSYDEAQAFVNRLTESTGEIYRIPSEAEWEYSCRAGSRGRYYWGDTIDATRAAFASCDGPLEPGSFPPNAFGLYDMHGNVREWTADLWHESYDDTPQDGRPATEGHSSMRVVRGGGWCDDASMLRSGARMRATQTIRTNVIGFRVARTLS